MSIGICEEQNIQRAIVKLGFPAMLGAQATLIYNLVDTYFVSLTKSPAQIAAVTLSTPILLTVGFSQGVAPLIGYCYGARQQARLNRAMKSGMVDDVQIGAAFTAAFLVLSRAFVSLFLHDAALVEQSALFLRIMSLSAPMLGIINMVTAYYQALAKAVNSLLITLLRNIILFIPCVILLNALVGLNGAIAAQPIVETILAAICIIMYWVSRGKRH